MLNIGRFKMKKDMKAWKKPELTVLVRTTQEEAVLTGCKGSSGTGPNSNYLGRCGEVEGTPCTACSLAPAS
jgi:hypothetical protein